MESMKRPHLEQLRGNHQNVYDEVKDYRTEKTRKNFLDLANEENQVLENHKFPINNAFYVPNIEPLSNEK